MEPGKGYKAHSDRHDVAIVLLDGEVTANGEAAGPGGVFYFAAGESHDMANTGNRTARYLVVEFLDDDLVYLELSPSGPAPQKGEPRTTSPMIAKTDYPGPSRCRWPASCMRLVRR